MCTLMGSLVPERRPCSVSLKSVVTNGPVLKSVYPNHVGLLLSATDLCGGSGAFQIRKLFLSEETEKISCHIEPGPVLPGETQAVRRGNPSGFCPFKMAFQCI